MTTRQSITPTYQKTAHPAPQQQQPIIWLSSNNRAMIHGYNMWP